jgi:hypothetical protein
MRERRRAGGIGVYLIKKLTTKSTKKTKRRGIK